MVLSPHLLGAAFRGECVWFALGFASLRATGVVLDASHALAPPRPLPAPGPCRQLPTIQAWGKTGQCQPGASPLSLPAPPWPSPTCLLLSLLQNMSKSLKKLVEESREKNQPEVDMSDRGISNMLDVNGLCKFSGRVFPLEPLEGLQIFQVAGGRYERL